MIGLPETTWSSSVAPIVDELHQEQPFVGSNTLLINMATMMKAIEFWLNSEVFQCDVTVKSVDYRDYIFTVAVEPQEGNNATAS